MPITCRNRHCPKCQGLARAQWLEDRQAELLPVPYFHVVFTVPAPVAEIAFQNKAAVYAKPPFGGPEQVLAYLGRYTHRVALTNSRLLDIEDGRVRFRWKDYRHHDKTKVMSLEAGEFIRRFLLHVLPSGFHRIRHFGFLANGHRAGNLALCRRLLAVPPPEPVEPAADYRERYRRLTGHSLETCPCCGGPMLTLGVLVRPARPGPLLWPDTS